MKVLVNVLFAKHFQTEMPEISGDYQGTFLLPRWMNNRFKHLAVRARSKNSLRDGAKVYSFFQGLKKGFLPIRADAIDKSLIGHMKALTKDPTCDQEILDYFDDVLEKEFSDIPKSMEKAWRLGVEPAISSKSTCEYPMGGFGQVGLGRKLFNFSQEKIESLVCQDDLTLRKTLDECVFLPEIHSFCGFASVVGKCWEPFAVYESVIDEYTLREEILNFRRFRNGTEEEWKNFRVQPAVVLEPMKGRIITKPASGTYIHWGRLQKALWKSLKKREAFQLVGRPVEEEDIWHVAGSYELGMGFNSGDFSGATDNLKGSVSKGILRFLFNRLPLEEILKIERSFCNSMIDYRKNPVQYQRDELGAMYTWKCTQQGVVQQLNGQLMGHILSFPILCIANYLIFRWTYRSLNLQPPNVRINGDDVLFCCHPNVYKHWCVQTTRIGFSPSLGKNLFQSDIAQINSVLFRVGFSEIGGRRFVRKVDAIPYMNMGILKMRGKGKEVQRTGAPGEQEITDYLPVLKNLYRMISGPWNVDLAIKKFWRDHWNLRGTLRFVRIDLEDVMYLPDSFWESTVSSGACHTDSLVAQRFSSLSLVRNSEKFINLRRRYSYLKRNPVDFSVRSEREDLMWI